MENTELTLRLPSVDDAEEIRAYRREFLETGGSMDGTGPLRRFDDPAEWLRETEKYASRNRPRGQGAGDAVYLCA